MAGIRPQIAAGGFSGVHIALVVFVVLWLVSTIGFVVLYTGQEKLQQDLQTAREELDRFANSAERARFGAYAQKPGQTVVGRLAEERGGMAAAVTGSASDDLATVQQKIRQSFDAIFTAGQIPNPDLFRPERSLSLLDAVRTLHDWLRAERSARQQAESQKQKLQAENLQLIKARDQSTQQFDQTVAKINEKLDQVQSDLQKYRQDRDKEVEQLTTQLSRMREQFERDANRYRAELRQREQDMNKLLARLDQALSTLKKLRGQPDELAAAREADGQIVRAVPGDPYVYINLGARDRLTLGLTFTVYGSQDGIPPSGEGKATIEVVTIYDDVAACRLVSRKPNQPVLEGDLVANAVYSKDRRYKFLVAGQFDMDFDGIPDPDGADRIKAMIKEWGGEIVEQLDINTDFAVLGRGPTVPPIAPAASASPIAKQRYRQLLDAYNAYQGLISEAKALMVPILNQTQFLHFVGYNLERLAAAE